MKFYNKNILLISPEPWGHIFVSKHHYAVHLAKRGNKVFFLNPPTKEMKVEKTEFSNLFSIQYKGFPKGLRYYPSPLQKEIIAGFYKKLQILCSTQFDVIWSFDNSVFFNFSCLPSQILKISHIVDLNQNFQTKKAASTADYCFCTSELIKKRLARYNGKVYKINHGFNPAVSDKQVFPIPFKGKTKALYSGNLAMPFIDWILLSRVIKDHPDVDFVFLGPHIDIFNGNSAMRTAKKAIINSANTYFVDKVESNVLQQYYEAVDILLIAYDEKFHDNQANPHKMMEYLGSGKMVVATSTKEYNTLCLNGLFLMSTQNADFPSVFNRALMEIDFWNSKDMQRARKVFALDNTYDKQIDRIESLIVHEK